MTAAENAAKTAFISRMSHDIRTPLNAILGLNALALESTDDPASVKGYLEKSSASGRLLLALVNNIIDVSKIESGKMELANEPCKLSDFFDEIGDIFGPLCADKNIEFSLESDASDAVVLTDSTRLNQVFCNLLSNAGKFTPAGGRVAFILRSTTEEDEGKKILHGDFEVSDTGSGIPADFQDKMFQSFTQVEGGTAQTQGSGLGLAIVKSIVTLMGGTIAVKSAVGRGTTFNVRLDFAMADAPRSEAKPSMALDDELLAKLRGRRALLVEDNSLNAEIVMVALNKAGMDADCAENGKVALDMLSKASEGYYDVVLMDNRMPVMNGLEATLAIRKMEQSWIRKIPVIAVTADAFDDEVAHFKEAGMDDFLAKPLDVQKMYRTIAKHIQ